MIDSPILNELIAEKVAEGMQKAVLALLEDRFGLVPLDLVQQVKDVTDADHLLQLTKTGGPLSRPGDLPAGPRRLRPVPTPPADR